MSSVGIRAVSALLASAALWSAPPKRVYIAPDDHTDYMWSGDEEAYRQAFVEMIDYYLDQADSTLKDPPAQQARWNCDGSFWMWTYEKNKTATQFQRFLDRIRDGHISVPLNSVVSCYGGTPLEAVLRGMYYSGRIERRHGLRFPLAVAMEDQTIPYGLGALWAGSGAQYSWKGVCGCASMLMPVRHNLRPHEIYWWQGPDKSRILMKWNSLFREGRGSNKCLGGYAEAFDPSDSLRFIESDQRFQQAWPYDVVGLFGKGWDNLKTMDDDVVKLARTATTPNRKIIVSNEEDFFRDFEAAYGSKLPVFSAAFGNEWDLYAASIPGIAGRVRRAVEKLRTAEGLATLVARRRPEFLKGRESARDLAFLNLGLFWEHNWTADGPVLRSARAEWGRRIAAEIESYVDGLETDAAYALGGLIRKEAQTRRFYVFNPLSWTRTDVADLPLDDVTPVYVVDLETGSAVPSQTVVLDWNRYTKGRLHLRVLARDVPPVGYRVYEIRSGNAIGADDGVTAQTDVIESPLYRVAVAGRGAITSLIDKSRGNREFAREIGGRAINDIGPAEGELAVENSGPVSVTLRALVRAPLARTARITLYRDVNRIDIANEITQNFLDVQTWSFAFNLESPDAWHEEVGAIIRARLAADGGHYSPVHSRLDWLSLNHFVSISGTGGAGITLSNADLAFMKLGSSTVIDGVSKLDTATPQISVLAGGQVDGQRLGIPAQGGDSQFLQRFALQTHSAFDVTQAMKFALEHQNPLRAAVVTGGDAYPERSFSFLRLTGQDAVLWALKPAEEGISEGVIARVWNLANAQRSISISLTDGIRAARRVSHIETDLAAAGLKQGAVMETIEGSQLRTYRIAPR